jgi:hypothetical protein
MITYRINIVILILPLFLISICSCKKKSVPPVLTTSDVIDISYTSAKAGGDVTDENGSVVITIGVCWNTSGSPTIDDSKTIEEGGFGMFTSELSQLSSNTKYYLKAYATNSIGTGYGNEVSFITMQTEVPVLTTSDITSITQNSAISGGVISSDGGSSIIERGVCWSTNNDPTILESKTNEGSGSGSYISNLIGLKCGTKYNVRAFAVNSAGTGYGQNVQFTNLYDLFPLSVGNEYIYVYNYSVIYTPGIKQGKKSIGKMKWTVISSINDNTKVEYTFEEKFNGIDIYSYAFTSTPNDTFQIIDRKRVFTITSDTSKIITLSNFTTNWLGTKPWDFSITRYQNLQRLSLQIGFSPKRIFSFSADSGLTNYLFSKGPNSNITTETMKLESLRILK